jgi:type I site-specific restriction endonuclease
MDLQFLTPKTMINVSNEPSDAHKKKKSLKEEIMEQITEKLMERIIDMVNQKVQDALKKFQDTKNKECEHTQKQINELREDFNKHQSETKGTIKTEIDELKMTTQNIKEELNKDMENIRKKNQTEILEIRSPFSQIKTIV